MGDLDLTRRALNDRTMLLFYDGYELRATEGRFSQLYAQARRIARFAYRTALRRQVHTGFYTAFLGLKASLRASGWSVRVNDFAAARANPDRLIGVAGYPSVVQRTPLPNPVIFGPGDYGFCEAAQRVASDPRYRLMIQPCQWAIDYDRAWVGDKSAVWFAGIDTHAWPDLSKHPKSVDVLIYDKIRWHRDDRVPVVLDPLIRHLQASGRTYEVLRYGQHHGSQFRAALSRSRTLAFLCEHETQGLAYQEAMASGLPVFAWDEGELVDPTYRARAPSGLAVSSVPYFDDRCGVRFTLADMAPRFDGFWERRDTFAPRAFVQDTLSLEASGRLYLELCKAALERTHPGT